MKNDHIERLEADIRKVPEDAQDKLGRLIGVLKIALVEFQTLKELVFSPNAEMKKASLEASQWLLKQIDNEFAAVSRVTGLKNPHILALLYQSEKLTPQDCQAFLQAQATILQNSNLLFPVKSEPKKAKPKKQKLRI